MIFREVSVRSRSFPKIQSAGGGRTAGMFLFLLFVVSFSPLGAAAPGCVGFAAVDGDDSQGMSLAGGTVGGAGGSAVTVATQAQLTNAATQSGPLTIVVQGIINVSPLGQQIKVQSNKSILGADCDSGIRGGTLDLDGKSNVILQGLVLGGTYVPGDPGGKCCNFDAITLWHSTHHVWVDHCDLSHCEDGLCDITDKANYITVSWCHFHDHNKVSLIGSSDTDTSDIGYLKVTFCHNWFDHVWVNAPRLRFGWVHLFNNYYTNVAQFCAWDTMAGQMVVENNNYGPDALNPYLIGTPTPTEEPQLSASGNIFDPTATGAQDAAGTAFDPATFYAYTLDNASDVPDEAMTGTGPCGLLTAAPTATPVPTVSAVWRVAAGGPAFTDSQGHLWSADTQYSGGYAFAVTATDPIADTTDPGLYQNERYGDLFNSNQFTYNFPVPLGRYQVTLKFAETDFTSPGDRIFDVSLNGVPVLTHFDIFSDAGGAEKADDKVFNDVAPVSGVISVAFTGDEADSPKVNALQVVAQPPTPTPTPFLTPTPTPTPPAPLGKPYVYSNPSSGPTVRFVYDMASAGTAHIRVWNASGQFVAGLSDSWGPGIQQSTLNIQAFAPGHYFYQVDLKYDSGAEDRFAPEVLAVRK